MTIMSSITAVILFFCVFYNVSCDVMETQKKKKKERGNNWAVKEATATCRVAEADNKGQCGMKILPSSQYYTLSSSRRPTVGNFLWFLSRLKSRAAEGQVRRVHFQKSISGNDYIAPVLINNPFDKIRKLTKKVRKIKFLSIPWKILSTLPLESQTPLL